MRRPDGCRQARGRKKCETVENTVNQSGDSQTGSDVNLGALQKFKFLFFVYEET